MTCIVPRERSHTRDAGLGRSVPAMTLCIVHQGLATAG